MLNTRALSDLFSQNCDSKLCQQWWLITPNGTLLANNGHVKITPGALRQQVASVTIAWQEHDAVKPSEDASFSNSTRLRDKLRTLTIEAPDGNTIVTRVQAQMLLVLVGGAPPRRAGFEPKTVAEGPDDQQYPTEGDSVSKLAKLDGTASRASSITSNAAVTVLRLQRKKLEAMANALADDFEQTGFQLPTDGSINFF